MMSILFLITLLLCLSPIHPAGAANTDGWENAAKMLEEAVDDTADPCNDWYQFACGNWLKNNQIPPGYSSANTGSVGNKASEQFREALSEVDPSTAIHAVKQGKLYHEICKTKPSPSYGQLNRDLIKLHDLSLEYGGWPALMPNWNGRIGGESYGSPESMMGSLFGRFGISTFIHVSVDPNWKEPQKWAYILHVGGYSSVDVNEIVSIMKSLANANNISIDNQLLKTAAQEIVKLETKLQSIVNQRPSLDNVTEAFYYTKDFDLPYHQYSLGDLQKRWWFIDWLELFKSMAKDNVPEKQLLINKFVVPYPEILDKLRDIYIWTSEETKQSFLIWRLLQQFVNSTNSKVCAITENIMSNAVSRPFIEKWMKLHSDKSIPELNSMVGYILDALRDMFASLKWMTPSSLQGANAKIDTMIRNIAHPQWILDDEVLNKIYTPLDLSIDDDPLTFAMKMHRFRAWTLVNHAGKEADFHLFNFQNHYLYTQNAWYQPWYNSITIPTAYVEYPLFVAEWPKAVSFGSMGGVIGHEITHGFDTTGVQWNSEGRKKYWMEEMSMKGFNDMAQCVIDQYKNICYPNLIKGDMRQGKCEPGNNNCVCVNGDNTKAEDIADSGGTLAAYLAYKRFINEHGAEKHLPGKLSKYTMDQVFWISYAYSWCSIETPKSLKQAAEAKHDLRGHSPEPLRAVEPLKNILPFAETFNCPIGSKMVPKEHCKVWIGNDYHNNYYNVDQNYRNRRKLQQ